MAVQTGCPKCGSLSHQAEGDTYFDCGSAIRGHFFQSDACAYRARIRELEIEVDNLRAKIMREKA